MVCAVTIAAPCGQSCYRTSLDAHARVLSRAVQGRLDGEHRAPQAAAVRAGSGRGGRHVVRAQPEWTLARHRGVFLEGRRRLVAPALALAG
jgi:hypothetical protein